MPPGGQLDRAAAELQRTGAGVGVDTSGCHPRSSLVGCYVASPEAFRPVIAAYARLRLAAHDPGRGHHGQAANGPASGWTAS